MRKRVLFAWEWGAGAGHLARFGPLARLLLKNGYHVSVALRELAEASTFFPDRRVEVYQAPLSSGVASQKLRDPRTFAGLTWNLGYSSPERVSAYLSAWISLLRACRPDMVLSDFGIGASIAASSLNIPRARLGTGFECPPPTHPLASLFSDQYEDKPLEDRIAEKMSEWIDESLRRHGLRRENAHIAEFIGSSRDFLLSTIEPFDPYSSQRHDAKYFGIWDTVPRTEAHPIRTSGKCVFAYLKMHAMIRPLLKEITDCGFKVVLVIDGGDSRSFSDVSPLVVPQESRVSMDSVISRCEFAVTNANHGTTVRLAVAGMPILACPLYIEQRATASRLMKEKIGLSVDPTDSSHYGDAVHRISDPDLRGHCERFASKYASRVGQDCLERAFVAFSKIVNN